MLCIEILQGDKVICRAGHEDAVLVTATVHLMAQPQFQRLIVSGTLDQAPGFTQHPRWLDMSLLRNEAVSFRIVEADTANEPEQVASFGTWPGDDKKYFCSFCGSAAENGPKMMMGVNANICVHCVRKFTKWATSDPA